MRTNKVVSIFVAGVLAASLVAGQAHAGKKKAAHQHVTGTIAVPMATPPDNVCNTGAHRRTTLFSEGNMPDGVVGQDFNVDPKTAGKPFVLSTDDPNADFDIGFYTSMGDTADPAGAPAYVDFEERAKGGESGIVPAGFEIAIVCLYEGQNSSFEYAAGKGVPAPKN